MAHEKQRARRNMREWYERKGEAYNEVRRQRYATDEDRRAAYRERSKKYRKSRAKGKVPERAVTRMVGDKEVPVLTTGQLAVEVGCSPQMLRSWEKKGWIPPSVFPDKHRYYMQHQVELVKALHKARVEKKNFEEQRKKLYDNW